MTSFIVLSIACLALGGVLVSCAYFGSRGTLPRNRWIGIRLSFALSSDEAWVAAHKAALGWGIIAALDVIICLSIGFIFLIAGEGLTKAMWGPRVAFVQCLILFVPYCISAERAAKRIAISKRG